MKDVRVVPGVLEVAERSVTGQPVAAQEVGLLHSGAGEDLGPDQLVVVAATGPRGNECEHQVRAVVVRVLLPRWAHLLVPLEVRQEGLGVGVLVHRSHHEVVVEADVAALVEVVPDARGVPEQVVDRDTVVDERKVRTQVPAHEGVEGEHAVLDQPHDRERREGLAAARRREPGRRRRYDAEPPVRVPVAGLEQHVLTPGDAHHPGEGSVLGSLLDDRAQGVGGVGGSRSGVVVDHAVTVGARPRADLANIAAPTPMPPSPASALAPPNPVPRKSWFSLVSRDTVER